ncbi:hypothetical protein NKH77_11205 [Streptomyces sp. M19]
MHIAVTLPALLALTGAAESLRPGGGAPERRARCCACPRPGTPVPARRGAHGAVGLRGGGHRLRRDAPTRRRPRRVLGLAYATLLTVLTLGTGAAVQPLAKHLGARSRAVRPWSPWP